MQNQWNWDQLRFFLALAEHGTLPQAGKHLSVSHSTVQRRIRSFEQTLQTTLFEHHSEGYKLTDAGITLHREVVNIRDTIDALSQQISGSDTMLSGDVEIATTDTIAFELLPPILNRLSERYPQLRLKVDMGSKMRNVLDHEADIAIRSCKQPPATLIGRKIGTIEFCACASVEYINHHALKAFPVDVTGHRFVVLDPLQFNRVPFHRWLESQLTPGVRVNIASNFLLASAMVRAGMGITVLPSYLCRNMEGLVALPTDGPIDNNDLWILCHRNLRDHQRIRVVRRYLYTALAKVLEPED